MGAAAAAKGKFKHTLLLLVAFGSLGSAPGSLFLWHIELGQRGSDLEGLKSVLLNEMLMRP